MEQSLIVTWINIATVVQCLAVVVVLERINKINRKKR